MRTNDLYRNWSIAIPLTWMLIFGSSLILHGQEKPAAEPKSDPAAKVALEIPDEPLTVDPTSLVPPLVAVPVTVDFDGVPLKNLFSWLQQDRSISLQIQYKALADAKILDTEPIHERLKDAPLYLLLNRLAALGIAWYVNENSVFITSTTEYQRIERTISYNLGDLFDAGYLPENLLRTITRCSGGKWNDSNSTLLLGDVAFIRQTDTTHLEIAGLLTALRKHGRRTFSFDSPLHAQIRAAMETKVTVDFQETPFLFAIQTLADQSQIEIRLDRATLSKSQFRERSPVTLKLTEQKLGSVLRAMLSSLGLHSYLRDGVLWITTGDASKRSGKTAVFDVRDLCRDSAESAALKDAIRKQTRTDSSDSVESAIPMETPLPGVLVVRHSESTLDEILQLLENYRTALRVSKVRQRASVDLSEVVTGYYRVPRPMAGDLKSKLPNLVLPGTWRTTELPDAPGSIVEISIDSKGDGVIALIASGAELKNVGDATANSRGAAEQVLIIRQTRAAHQLIGKLIQKLMDAGKVDVEASAEAKAKAQIDFGSSLLSAP